jgi:hypothetical protein
MSPFQIEEERNGSFFLISVVRVGGQTDLAAAIGVWVLEFSTDELADRVGLRLRPVALPDYPVIEQIAWASFPSIRGLLAKPMNRAHYDPDWTEFAIDRFGEIVVSVAENRRGRVCAYCYQQLRPSGELYIKEIAAIPRDPADRVPLAGTLLLARAIEEALRCGGSGPVAVNIPAPLRGDIHDPVPYYERLGFGSDCLAPGYTATSAGRPFPTDAWLTGDRTTLLATIRASIERPARTYPQQNRPMPTIDRRRKHGAQ